MATERGGSTKPVAVIILGADALLAARPATAIQLWHACLAAAYDLAVPATWGDELVAAECLRAVGNHPETVTVMCSCPLVARAIGDGDADLSAQLVCLVAPPVATARYLRRVYGERRVHITFVGACPAAGDSAIDAWLTPVELLERFAANEIDLARQPQLFESVLPPDRRRHLSLPGGLPTPERTAGLGRPRQVVEVNDADFLASIRRHLMSGVRTLVDVAPRIGCACSGAVAGVSPAEARLAVALVEPPRSARPVIVDPVGLGLLRRVPPRPRPGADVRREQDRAAASRGPGADAHPEGERTMATSRPASRSPLSWTLRERALPQPPTTGRSPDPSRRGASSTTWGAPETALPNAGSRVSGESEPRTAGNAVPAAVDAATAAAVRALELAARGPGPVTTAGSATSSRSDREPPAPPIAPAGHEVVGPTTVAGRHEPAAPSASGAGVGSGARTSRATPPGGYWFVSASAAGTSDAEVARDPAIIEDGRSDIEGDAAPTGEETNVVEQLEALFSQSATAPPTDDSTTGVAEGDTTVPDELHAGEAPRGKPDQEGDPPHGPWVLAMTIILLIAGAIVARGIAQRRNIEPPIVARALTARVESVSLGSLPPPPEAVAKRSPSAAAGDTDPVMPLSVRPKAVRRRASATAARTSRNAVADSVTVGPASSPSPPLREAADSAIALRDAELRSIREELARRAAKLDSMGRAVGALFASPRVAPARGAPPPPPPGR